MCVDYCIHSVCVYITLLYVMFNCIHWLDCPLLGLGDSHLTFAPSLNLQLEYIYICPQIPGGNTKIDFVTSKGVLVEVRIMIVTT